MSARSDYLRFWASGWKLGSRTLQGYSGFVVHRLRTALEGRYSFKGIFCQGILWRFQSQGCAALCEELGCRRSWACPLVHRDRSVMTHRHSAKQSCLLVKRQVGQSISIDIPVFLKIIHYFFRARIFASYTTPPHPHDSHPEFSFSLVQ